MVNPSDVSDNELERALSSHAPFKPYTYFETVTSEPKRKSRHNLSIYNVTDYGNLGPYLNPFRIFHYFPQTFKTDMWNPLYVWDFLDDNKCFFSYADKTSFTKDFVNTILCFTYLEEINHSVCKRFLNTKGCLDHHPCMNNTKQTDSKALPVTGEAETFCENVVLIVTQL